MSHILGLDNAVCITLSFLCVIVHQFLAAQDKLMVWVDLRSLVDFFTIAPSFVTLFSRRAWLGKTLIHGSFHKECLLRL